MNFIEHFLWVSITVDTVKKKAKYFFDYSRKVATDNTHSLVIISLISIYYICTLLA